jgi:hypothetical protein
MLDGSAPDPARPIERFRDHIHDLGGSKGWLVDVHEAIRTRTPGGTNPHLEIDR